MESMTGTCPAVSWSETILVVSCVPRAVLAKNQSSVLPKIWVGTAGANLGDPRPAGETLPRFLVEIPSHDPRNPSEHDKVILNFPVQSCVEVVPVLVGDVMRIHINQAQGFFSGSIAHCLAALRA